MPENRPPGRAFKFGEFLLFADERMVMRGEERVRMTPRVFHVLLILVENAGRLVTKEALLNEVWQDSFVEEGNLNSNVSRLRKILGEKPNENLFIETIPKVGYRFIAPVESVSDEAVSDVAAAVPDSKKTDEAVAVPTAKRPHRRLWLIAAVVLLSSLSVLIGGWFIMQRARTPATAAKTEKNVPVRVTVDQSHDTRATWKVDGQIRFERWMNKEPFTFVVNADGTNLRRDTSIPGLRTGTWTADEKRVLFYKEGDTSGALYMADAEGSNETRLPFQAGNTDWSPDGRKIVYQHNGPQNSEIFIYDLDSGRSEKVVSNPLSDGDPSFSPDGRRIAFVSGRDGNAEIYVQDIDGSNLQRLTNDLGRDAFPVFSPDGTQIVFNREDESLDIYIMRSDGSDVRRLTNWPGNEEAYPGCWSRDGTQIYFSSDRFGKDNIFRLDVEPFETHELLSDALDLRFPHYSPDGAKVVFQAQADDLTGELRVLDVNTQNAWPIIKTHSIDGYPKFSPDGNSILFQDRLGDNSEICLISSDGSGEVQNLTNNPARDVVPSWSPDGSRITFTSNRDGKRDMSQIYVMNADGSNQYRIYYSSALNAYPTWSPDGKRIAFANDKEDGRTGNFEIFTIEPETTEPEMRLTFRRHYDISPAYSPDGNRIAFVSNLDGNSEIYLMSADGSGLLRLTRSTAEDTHPSWSPDGKRIIFSSNRTGRYAIYELALE
jgi:Tol biopolymer transport system component/DNA-binding winged helix-turn-helix (wHTH) protein